MKAHVISIGTVFGKFTVVSPPVNTIGTNKWVAKCECGGLIMATTTVLKNKAESGKGCKTCEPLKNFRHGHATEQTPTYRSWYAMKQRCLNPKNKCFDRYGGRGITFHSNWSAFSGFIRDMGERPEGMTLDRRDHDGDYEPGNCRWATDQQQAENRSTCKKVTAYGVEYPTVTSLARAYSVNYKSIASRMKSGMTAEQAIEV